MVIFRSTVFHTLLQKLSALQKTTRSQDLNNESMSVNKTIHCKIALYSEGSNFMTKIENLAQHNLMSARKIDS